MFFRKEVLVGFILFSIAIILYFTFFLVDDDQLPFLDQVEPFVLETPSGETFKSDNEKVKLIAFFYTRCPNICPMTMSDFKDLQAQLKEEQLFGRKVELIGITLDPEYDDAERIREYAGLFDADPEGWKFLRGSTLETKQIAGEYHMKYKKVSGDFIAHNTTMFLIDQDNNIRGLYDMANEKMSIDQAGIMRAIRKLVDE